MSSGELWAINGGRSGAGREGRQQIRRLPRRGKFQEQETKGRKGGLLCGRGGAEWKEAV